jgi:hypothetical protein
MITLRDPQKVELAENIMADLLMRNGIDPRAIKSEQQLKNIINQIEAASKQTTQTGIRNTESAKVFDLEGKEIPKGSKIMGGKAIDDDLPPPGSRGGPDDIAAPVQSSEETIKNMIEAENKKGIENLKQKMAKEKARTQRISGNLRADNLQRVEIGKPKLDKDEYDYYRELLDDEENFVVKGDETKEFLEAMVKEQEDEVAYMKRLYDKGALDDPEDFAKGGIARIGLKDGMNRRTFLKLLGGAASIPIIGKIFKPLKVGKTVTKVPIIKTDNVAGKPEWFDQLVNKVILEGDDMTKQFATKERQIVHATKIGEDDYVRVTQDLDEGSVRVEYDSPANTFEDTVQLQYKKPLPDEGDPNPMAEFEVAESGPVGRQTGPDDFDLDVDEVGGTSIRDLDSDVSKLKEYATGEKPSMKELVKNIERRKRARQITEDPEAQTDAVIRRQGEMLDVDPEPDFASGGIARMLGE